MLKRSIPSLLGAIPITVFVIMGAGVSPAAAAQPWWHLTSGSDPANVQPHGAHDQVQELTIKATGGRFGLEKKSGSKEELSFPYNATHQELEAALIGAYGVGNVEVPEGEGNETGSKPYKIVFTGELAHRPFEGFEVISRGEEVNTKELTCNEPGGDPCSPSGYITTAVKGRPDGQIVLTAQNVGDAGANGGLTPVKIADTLPAGLEAVAIEGKAQQFYQELGMVTCSIATLSCEFAGVLEPYEQIQVVISVEVKPVASSVGEVNRAEVSGGGALGASVARAVTIDEAPTPFGVEGYEMAPEEADGAVDTQAGSHPFQLTTTFALNQSSVSSEPPALAKDLNFNTPPGLVGNPTVFPQCSEEQFLHADPAGLANDCPAKTVMGVAAITVAVPNLGNVPKPFVVPLFNLVPAVGEPARFGFFFDKNVVFLDTSVRTGRDYGVTVSSDNITQKVTFISSRVTFWGVPGDPRHDNSRGWSCIDDEYYHDEASEIVPPCTFQAEKNPAPFLTLPTSCTGPLQTTVEADSWKEAGAFASFPSSESLPALDGCNRLPFAPSISALPDLREASKPSGLKVDVHVPQAVDLDPEGLSASDVKGITVALPEGLALNPSAADGLQACPLLKGAEPAKEAREAAGQETGINLETPQPANCPNASKLATVMIHSPDLPNPLKGFVYLAAPQNFAGIPQNPFSSLVAMYLVARDPVSGVLVKLAGSVSLNEATGQVTSTFANEPQLPFEDAELEFFGGERAPLATPARCGTYTSGASFAPWSGNESVFSEGQFVIATGPGGSACPGTELPFNASLASGTTDNDAGSFSNLSTTLSRPDGNQSIQSVTLHYPPGLGGLLPGVKLCPEAQANAGTCGPESEIGESIVSVGVGGDPYTVTGGKAYITEKYEGAPFGLSIVNPAAAGPYVLQEGRPVVVRAKIEVNPITAALTVTAGPIPTIIEGFPLQIQHVNVMIDGVGGKSNFTFNPTNCTPMAVAGTIDSAEGASTPVSTPFQATNCQALRFAPNFKASTSGKTSKVDGASLTTTIDYPTPFTSYANIAKVKVDLPKQLPSRLTTLQKACTAAQFNANPAGCPAASIVGHAQAITPVLPVPLEGPAYFVSNGNEAFPNLIMVLQGYGVKIDLVGDTFIDRKTGITSSTFNEVPDQPVTSFQLTLPEQPYSALAANGSLCTQKLALPTAFVAQNGSEIHRSTPVEVTGCSGALSVVSYRVKKKTLILSVYAPTAGKVRASGKGVASGAKTYSGHESLTLILKQKGAGELRTTIRLSFTPSKGKKQFKKLSVKFSK